MTNPHESNILILRLNSIWNFCGCSAQKSLDEKSHLEKTLKREKCIANNY